MSIYEKLGKQGFVFQPSPRNNPTQSLHLEWQLVRTLDNTVVLRGLSRDHLEEMAQAYWRRRFQPHELVMSGLTFPEGSSQRAASVFVLDCITRNHTAFASFLDLLNAEGNYRPTIRCYDVRTARSQRTRDELRLLADAYDYCMERRGDERRAYRGTVPYGEWRRARLDKTTSAH